MIHIQFYGLLRLQLKIEKMDIECEQNITVRELLLDIQKKVQDDFLYRLIDDDKKIVPGTIILINQKNIFHLSLLDSIVTDGDTVALFPPGAGG